MKCLSENNYDKSQCQDAFENYRACKKFWGAVTVLRRKKGIEPYLAPIEDRNGIKELYKKTGEIPATPEG